MDRARQRAVVGVFRDVVLTRQLRMTVRWPTPTAWFGELGAELLARQLHGARELAVDPLQQIAVQCCGGDNTRQHEPGRRQCDYSGDEPDAQRNAAQKRPHFLGWRST